MLPWQTSRAILISHNSTQTAHAGMRLIAVEQTAVQHSEETD
jgi:hypothetical protein